VLRFEAIVHNTRALRTGRVLDRFPEIVARLAGMVDRFTSMLDCVDVGFLPDGILDQLPLPAQIGATRVGGIDLNTPRMRAALSAVLALAIAPAIKPGASPAANEQVRPKVQCWRAVSAERSKASPRALVVAVATRKCRRGFLELLPCRPRARPTRPGHGRIDSSRPPRRPLRSSFWAQSACCAYICPVGPRAGWPSTGRYRVCSGILGPC